MKKGGAADAERWHNANNQTLPTPSPCPARRVLAGLSGKAMAR